MFVPEVGKTGITGIVTGLMFFVLVFFAPIFASIPPWATGGAPAPSHSAGGGGHEHDMLIGVSFCSYIRSVCEINWNYIGDAVPAFLTIIIIPLSYKLSSHSLDWLIYDH